MTKDCEAEYARDYTQLNVSKLPILAEGSMHQSTDLSQKY